MIIFLSVYCVIAFIVFTLFVFPVFQDWNDYSAKDVRNCVLFAFGAGLLWLVIAALLITLICCGAYYSWKDRKGKLDIED